MSEVTLNVTLNVEQELFVIPSGSGYSCLGFDVAMQRANMYSAWLRAQGLQEDDVPPEARGTIRGYKAYETRLYRVLDYCRRKNMRCPVELTPQLIGLEGKRVEVVDCYGNKRRFQVGKSMGPIPIHLEILRRNSSGGPAVSGAPFQSIRRFN